jgi:hypothetical protein
MKWTEYGGIGKVDERRESYCDMHVDMSISKVEKPWKIKPNTEQF